VIAVVDYGAGNLRSVTNLLDSIDSNYRVVDSGDGLLGASHIILPGVGHFAQICQAFDRLRIRESIIEAIRSGTPYLGICLGMQVLFEKSDEAPGQKGLGVLSGSVNKLDTTARIPHMGWNTLDGDAVSILCDVQPNQYAYFAHSYFCPINEFTVRSTTQGCTFASVIEHGNVFGVQFHPEKSGALGASLVRKFVDL
jgi:imidazole glycerol phosphate synthase glutamine amidotransferase subunit